jgi:hypothetical protein
VNQGGTLGALVIGPLALGLLVFSGCSSGRDPGSQDGGGMTGAATHTEWGAVPWKAIQVTTGHTHRPPLAGAPIALKLLAGAGAAKQGQVFKFAVRIANTGDQPVSLQPCAAYRVQYLPHVETGLLNCSAAPPAIPAHGHVDFEMQERVPNLGKPTVGGHYTLLWQLGGEGYEGKTVRATLRLEPQTN